MKTTLGSRSPPAEQLAYDTWIAQEVHSLGMAVFQKNDPDQAASSSHISMG